MTNTTLEKWEEKTLGEIAYIKGGKRLPKGEKLSTEKTNHPYIRVTDFNDKGTVDIDNVQFITNDIYEQIKNYTISSYDLYISIAGTIGKAGIIPQELDGANLTENACKLVYKSKDILNKYIYYYTQTNMFAEQIFDKTKMAAMPKLALTRLATVKLLVPPLPEQERIVAKLDKAFEAIDKVKANAEKNLYNAKELFESHLKKYFEISHNTWNQYKLSDITTKIGSGATPLGGKKSYIASGVSLIRSMNVHDREFIYEGLAHINEKQAKQLDVVTVQEYDVLLNITGASVARCCVVPNNIIPARVNQHVSIIRPKKDLITPKFLCYLLTSNYYKSKLLKEGEEGGSTRQALTKTGLEQFKVYIPSISEQQKIVEKLDALQKQTKQLEQIYTQKIKECDELKQSILQKAFRGEL